MMNLSQKTAKTGGIALASGIVLSSLVGCASPERDPCARAAYQQDTSGSLTYVVNSALCNDFRRYLRALEYFHQIDIHGSWMINEPLDSGRWYSTDWERSELPGLSKDKATIRNFYALRRLQEPSLEKSPHERDDAESLPSRAGIHILGKDRKDEEKIYEKAEWVPILSRPILHISETTYLDVWKNLREYPVKE